jgi:hypothetical protein
MELRGSLVTGAVRAADEARLVLFGEGPTALPPRASVLRRQLPHTVPPSTLIAWPVIHLPRSVTRKRTISAHSLPSPG